MTDRKGSNHGLLGLKLFFFFIRMFCSMPFILDDRKLLCCQDAAAEIEGRSHISILQLESYSNEFAERGEKSRDKQMRINRVPFSSLSLSRSLPFSLFWGCVCTCACEGTIHFLHKDFGSPVFAVPGKRSKSGNACFAAVPAAERTNTLQKFRRAWGQAASHGFPTRVRRERPGSAAPAGRSGHPSRAPPLSPTFAPPSRRAAFRRN